MRRILHLLLDAERPVILAGGGVLRSRATADLVRLAEFVDVPVIAAWRRPDVFPNDNPRYLGMSGYFAAPTVRRRLEEADAILVIGCRLNEVATYGHAIPAAGTRWAHVDVEPLGSRPGPCRADDRARGRRAHVPAGGATGPRAGVLDAGGLERRRAAMAADRSAYEEARRVDEAAWDGPGVHPGRVVATLNRVLSPDTIVTTDAGNFGGWAARGLILRRPGTFVGTTAGAMGFAIPAAVAASLAGPGRPVVALAGDGGAGMTIAELETAVRVGVHPVVLVFDNERYGTIHDHQVRRGLEPVATDLGPVDWVRVAEGYGALGAPHRRGRRVRAGASGCARRGPPDRPPPGGRPPLGLGRPLRGRADLPDAAAAGPRSAEVERPEPERAEPIPRRRAGGHRPSGRRALELAAAEPAVRRAGDGGAEPAGRPELEASPAPPEPDPDARGAVIHRDAGEIGAGLEPVRAGTADPSRRADPRRRRRRCRRRGSVPPRASRRRACVRAATPADPRRTRHRSRMPASRFSGPMTRGTWSATGRRSWTASRSRRH